MLGLAAAHSWSAVLIRLIRLVRILVPCWTVNEQFEFVIHLVKSAEIFHLTGLFLFFSFLCERSFA
jgi:hypothetical protein